MKKSLILLIVLALALTVVQPVQAAGKWVLNIHNNTEGSVKLKLTGPEKYSFTVATGKVFETVEEGTYDYSYTACGVEVNGKITVTSDDQWLVIENCPGEVIHAKFVIDSHLGDPVTLEMSGPEDYELAISLGSNRFLTIASGEYVYSYEACGTTFGGTVRVLKNGTARLRLLSCERAELLSFGLPNPSNLMMGNHFSFPINITLSGPKNYYIQANPGFNRLDVIRGEYTYLFVAFGRNYSGTLRATGGATWVAFAP